MTRQEYAAFVRREIDPFAAYEWTRDAAGRDAADRIADRFEEEVGKLDAELIEVRGRLADAEERLNAYLYENNDE